MVSISTTSMASTIGQIARDTAHAGAVRAVRRQLDLDRGGDLLRRDRREVREGGFLVERERVVLEGATDERAVDLLLKQFGKSYDCIQGSA